MELALKVLLAYLLGSIVGSLVLGRLRGGVDIRTLGSGNAGGTNALRTQGKAFALWVVLIDIGKGWLAAAAIPAITLPWVPAAAPTIQAWVAPACGFAAVLGHVLPLWHGFRGGKGAATLVGAIAGLKAWLLVPLLGTWVLAVVAFGFVGLASMLAAAAVPIALLVKYGTTHTPLLVFALSVALVVIVTHRSNLARMLAHTEPRAQRLWLLGRRRSP